MDIHQLIQQAIERHASDLHLAVGAKPCCRIDGAMHTMSEAVCMATDFNSLVEELLNKPQQHAFAAGSEIDVAVQLGENKRFRLNLFEQQQGAALVMRVLPDFAPQLAALNAPKVLAEIVTVPRGLVLVTGPTGSGKSTTLAAMVDCINRSQPWHIITIEDPIECIHKAQRSRITQRELHHHTESFAMALKAALRQDPDVILVGELRDLETIRMALTAAETGHLVLATLHTSSAPKTIDRIIDVFPGDERAMVRTMLAESLRAVVSQRLVPAAKGGRVAAYEIMRVTPAIRNLIRDDRIGQIESTMQTSAALGMQTMSQALTKLVREQHITAEEGKHVSELW